MLNASKFNIKSRIAKEWLVFMVMPGAHYIIIIPKLFLFSQ